MPRRTRGRVIVVPEDGWRETPLMPQSSPTPVAQPTPVPPAPTAAAQHEPITVRLDPEPTVEPPRRDAEPRTPRGGIVRGVAAAALAAATAFGALSIVGPASQADAPPKTELSASASTGIDLSDAANAARAEADRIQRAEAAARAAARARAARRERAAARRAAQRKARARAKARASAPPQVVAPVPARSAAAPRPTYVRPTAARPSRSAAAQEFAP